MNLDRVPSRTEEEISGLVEDQMRKIQDIETVQGLRTFLINPRLEMRFWNWKTPVKDYPVWIVAESSKYDHGIAFSDYGFAPEYPWGLVFSSNRDFDADYCWYPTLEQAYKESRLIEEYVEDQQQR